MSRSGCPRIVPITTTRAQKGIATPSSSRASSPICSWSGVGRGAARSIMAVIRPRVESLPTAVTTATPRPRTMCVPALSSPSSLLPVPCSTGCDSPVTRDSSAISLSDSMSRASAGTREPVDSMITSSMTSSSGGSSRSSLSRQTRARGAESLPNAEIARFARHRVAVSIPTTVTITPKISAASRGWPRRR